MTEIQRDIKMFYNPSTKGDWGDFEIDAGDFVLENGLETLVLVSLFSDMRVNKEDSYNGETRGFWAERLLGFNLGSKLWLLDRSKIDKKTLSLAKQYSKDALDWTIQEGIFSKVETAALKSDKVYGIDLYIAAYKPDGDPEKFKYSIFWDRQLGR